MLRIPNPGSDIDTFIRIYRELYNSLQGYPEFGLDDMTRVLISSNLATSSGYSGEEALARSTRDNRSLDPLYNQSKMYSELYRLLGWLQSSPNSALRFTMTYLGAHVAAARRDPRHLVVECLLGLVYPNPAVNVGGDYLLRPFATILRTIAALGGLLSRDEIIVGPMCLADDRNPHLFDHMVERLRWTRAQGLSALEEWVEEVTKQRAITRTTMENYTRFPLAVLGWTGWTQQERRRDFYARPIAFRVLTGKGRKMVQWLEQARDIRAFDIAGFDVTTQDALVRVSFYEMLTRAQFDVGQLGPVLETDRKRLASVLAMPIDQPLLFSPYQELQSSFLVRVFPQQAGTAIDPGAETANSPVTERYQLQAESLAVANTARVGLAPLKTASSRIGEAGIPYLEQSVADLFNHALRRAGTIEEAVGLIVKEQAGANKDTFYPLVATLFRALGYRCETSRAGVNYQRWDALIEHETHSMPIEIKSPGEEEQISVKAVRQALENRVVLLARAPYPTTHDTTSLVVGYKLPNDRAEVLSLVYNVYQAFGFNIGILDLATLLRLVLAQLLEGKTHNSEDVFKLRGIAGIAGVADVPNT
jgi:hypothetical protein